MLHIPDDLKPFSHEITGINKTGNGFLLTVTVHESTPDWVRTRIAEMAKRSHRGEVKVVVR